MFGFFFFSGPYGCVDTDHTLSLLRRILEGVEYIHSRGIMHRDLKVSYCDLFDLIRSSLCAVCVDTHVLDRRHVS